MKPINEDALVDEALQGLINVGILHPEHEVVSVYHERFEYGYPTPALDRDTILERVIPALEAKDIYSRGRFGGWKYEISNQDHSFMLGVELVDRLMLRSEELTLNQPNWVNGRYNAERSIWTEQDEIIKT